MTASEFKSWLDGFLDGRQHRPTVKDLELIAEKASELEDGTQFVSYASLTKHDPNSAGLLPLWPNMSRSNFQ